MADFDQAFSKMIKNEGGYKLHQVKGDRGGITYAGISKKFHPDWQGWAKIGRKEYDAELTGMVRVFYLTRFWNQIQGSSIENQIIAENIFDFAVNAGWRVAAKIVQVIVGTAPDGIIGEITLGKINEIGNSENKMAVPLFIAHYALAKMARYAEICTRRERSRKFLLGWTKRTLKMASGERYV